ncbi:hypothetical protein BT69DRAFT_1348377 [Atractiella rhizophila]|nr:hypothetical protein BT69DRAFT_1348377 [Atractiella rhizophila]
MGTPPSSDKAQAQASVHITPLRINSDSHLEHDIPPVEETNEKAYENAAEETKGKFREIAPEPYLKHFFPNAGDENVEFKKVWDARRIPILPKGEKYHYDPTIEYLKPFLNDGWILVNTSGKSDNNFMPVHGAKMVRPDVLLYDNTETVGLVMKKAQCVGEFKVEEADEPFQDQSVREAKAAAKEDKKAKDKKKTSPVLPNAVDDNIRRTANIPNTQSDMELDREVGKSESSGRGGGATSGKLATGESRSKQVAGQPYPSAVTTPSRDNPFPFETDTKAGIQTRGQLVVYSTIALSCQERTRSFSFFIRQTTARLLSHSRAGFWVSSSFDWTQQEHLCKFFWELTRASKEERGIDTTMIPVSNDDPEALHARVALKITATNPLFKVVVGGKTFYISAPFKFRHNQSVGRGTRCFEAYDPLQKSIVLLKDTWRHARYPEEASIYAELHEAEVPNVLHVVANGDIDGPLQSTSIEFGDNDLTHQLAHSRLVLSKVGKSLTEFSCTYELVKGLADALEAHYYAWDKLKMLHRDISVGNIILVREEKDCEIEFHGFLIDWEFAKKETDGGNVAERTGTWEFMSIRLLESLQHKTWIKHEPRDDIESFVYVLCWVAARSAPSTMTSNKRGRVLNKFKRVSCDKIDLAIDNRLEALDVGNLKINSPYLKKLCLSLFQSLKFLVRFQEEMEAGRIFSDDEDSESEQVFVFRGDKTKPATGRMLSHGYMRKKFQRALTKGGDAWRKQGDSAYRGEVVYPSSRPSGKRAREEEPEPPARSQKSCRSSVVDGHLSPI